MREIIKKMTYARFKEWCNERACDGEWGMLEAMIYTSLMKEIDAIKVKGLFKKRETNQARESAWRKLISEQ